jgi:Ig domain of plant-specific actin-binding protein
MMKLKGGVVALVVIALAAIFAAAARAAAPVNSALPTISGTAKVGATLTASDGTWTNSPTSFAYQWQRCASDGTGCGDITGATSKTYSPTTGDVGHALRVSVTAGNSDGKASATSGATDPVDSANGPSNSVRPSVSGTAQVGETLTVSNGSWSTAPSSFTRQWQRCDSDGTSCLNISGATGQTYGIRTGDIGHRLRALVTAHTSNGQTTVASSLSAVVASPTGTTVTQTQTTTTTTTTTRPAATPKLAFISLRVRGAKAYARFRVCDDRGGRITITARDNHNRVLAVTHRVSVMLVAHCNTYSRAWLLRHGFRTPGRYVATLRARDAQGHLSVLRSRSILFR